ncbi:glycosyltransferase family 4 protein [Salinicoccus cyprini]|uniref:Glycosyltransferase family 4 protein n=1 Tax=Salinicoccus cyprini TaxID=2493691 RepID=A0A558AXC9_9STAP|nr:glycosyltransferase family 4 protein [Salinicoccus cyprini]TVT28916.1 glycosyltransferase family 4 protein [Salinicoccus cyprini]
MKKRNEVIHLVTVSKSLYLLRGQLEYLKNKGYKISLASSPGKELTDFNETSRKYTIPMEREISVFKDVFSLIRLLKLFLNKQPLIVNSGTPKAGLLGILSAYLTNVPIRIYTMRGLKLQTTKGVKFYVLWLMEKLCCTLATDVLCISKSIQEEVIKLKLVTRDKTVVLGNGSSNGINISLYPEKFNTKELVIDNYNHNLFTLGYIGRLVKDKGIDDVIQVYQSFKNLGYSCQLLLVGSIEEGDPISKESYDAIKEDKNIVYLPHLYNPSKYYYLIDVFLFLTAREGFGNVSIESQAASTPVIAYNVTGAKDTIQNGKTGFIIDKGNVEEVLEKAIYFYNNRAILQKYGENSREFVLNNFSNEVVWDEMDQFYQKRINEVK